MVINQKDPIQNQKDRVKAVEKKIEREKIVGFFLNLYSLQTVGFVTSSKLFRLKSHRQNNTFTYELKLKHNGKWVSRPMGIIPIVEATGKKSRCYKVIYDNVLVVKVPLKPVRHFGKYIDIIGNERKIANTLQPEIECIVSEVSTILKKIPSFYRGTCWIPQEIEDRCLERLKHFPKFQEHLKIDGGFVFFMDISKYSFLFQVLDDLYNLNEKIKQEIIKHPGFILKFQNFEERYGVENTSVWLQINEFFQDYLNATDSLLKKHGLFETVHDYSKRQWFLECLAQKKIMSGHPSLSIDFFNDLNLILSTLRSQHAGTVNEYIKTIKAFVKKETFLQTKVRISGIVGGILKLLSMLKEKKVAIRDLKPDNIFVAENSSNLFNSATPRNDVYLGLIDLETAVTIHVTKIDKLQQPLVGGTPSYATPSHFVPNDLLSEFFGDASRILLLQDWHACLGMIYLAATGKLLFESTKNLLYEAVKCFLNLKENNEKLISSFKVKNHHFWQSAENEFTKKMFAKEKILKESDIVIPYQACTMFLNELDKLKLRTEEKNRWVNILNSQDPKISTYNLLILMFKIIAQTMHRTESNDSRYA